MGETEETGWGLRAGELGEGDEVVAGYRQEEEESEREKEGERGGEKVATARERESTAGEWG